MNYKSNKLMEPRERQGESSKAAGHDSSQPCRFEQPVERRVFSYLESKRTVWKAQTLRHSFSAVFSCTIATSWGAIDATARYFSCLHGEEKGEIELTRSVQDKLHAPRRCKRFPNESINDGNSKKALDSSLCRSKALILTCTTPARISVSNLKSKTNNTLTS